MNDLTMIGALERLKQSVQVHGAPAFTQLGKSFVNAESTKAIQNDEKIDMAIALQESGIMINSQECGELAKYFEKDPSGGTTFNNVFIGTKENTGLLEDKLIRANMHFNTDGSGELVIEELVGNFNLENNEKYKNGDLTDQELFDDLRKHHKKYTDDGSIHHGYSKIRATIDDQNNYDITTSSGQEDIS